MSIEELLNELGYKGFRDMSCHTDGKWRVRSPKNKEGKRHMTSGRTPEIALQKMLDWYKNKPMNNSARDNKVFNFLMVFMTNPDDTASVHEVLERTYPEAFARYEKKNKEYVDKCLEKL